MSELDVTATSALVHNPVQTASASPWQFSLSENVDNLGRYLKRAQFVLLPNRYGPTGLLRARFNDAVFVSLTRGYLFASNEKVANSTIRATFQTLEGDGRLPIHYKPMKRWTGPLLQPSDIADFPDYLEHGRLKKFCAVRHPFARLVSCYRNKLEGKTDGRGYRRMTRDLGIERWREGVSFPQFIEAIARQDQQNMNAHWRPQYYNTFMDMISYDEIIRYEDVSTRLPELIQELYPSIHMQASAQKAVISRRVSDHNSDQLVARYFTEDLARCARDIYRIDFETFGFDGALSPVS